MGRVDLARVGFVWVGAWIVVTALLDTVQYMSWFGRVEWVVYVYGVALVALGVLIVTRAGALARRTTGGGGEDGGGALRLVDLQRTGITLLGLWVVVWSLPGVLAQLHRIPWLMRTATADGEGSVASYELLGILQGLFATALGAALLLGSRSLGASWAKRVGNVTFQPASAVEASTPRRGRLADLQAVGFSLLGLYLLADSLPQLLAMGLRYEWRSPFEWSLEEQLTWNGSTIPMAELLKAALGVALFLGARGLAGIWYRLRTFGMSPGTATDRAPERGSTPG